MFPSSILTCNLAIWCAKVEGKHKMFAWLAVQQKVLTADKLAMRNWPCSPICSLCDQEQETVSHICIYCPFTKEVWQQVKLWRQEEIFKQPTPEISIRDWWNERMSEYTTSQKREKAAIIIYTIWNIWKERNRSVFQQKTTQPQNVLGFIKEEMRLREWACGEQPPGGVE